MILFVRHGQTDCNLNNIIQGHLDAPLNKIGISQAKNTAIKLKDVKIDIIYSSPLIRAKKTADIINGYHHCPIITDENLKEQNAGDATGMNEKDITEEMKTDFFNDPHKFNAESEEDLYQRTIQFFKNIENVNKNILIVAHRGNYKAIYRYLNKLSSSEKVEGINNCEIKILKR